jgi:RNA polymerase sigma-70 factor (ECF subfamily)
MLDTSEESVKGALKRARATLERSRGGPDRDRAPLPGSASERELVRRFADAWEADDIDGVVSVLTHDAWLTMPPSPLEYQGVDAIGSFLRELAAWRSGQHYRLVATRANTQPAFGCYRRDPDTGIAHSAGMIVLTLQGDQIAAITRFLDRSVMRGFELPERLPNPDTETRTDRDD